MIKSEFIDHVAAKLPEVSAKNVTDGVNEILEIVSEALLKKQRVEVRGMGSFELTYSPPRNAHNPKTGAKVRTAPKHRVHFKPGLELRDRVNAGSAHHPLPKEE